MALLVRGTSVASSDGSSNTVAITIPSATQAGDLLLQFVVGVANGITQTPPAGWTSLATLTPTSSSAALRGTQRRAQGGDANTLVNYTLAGNTRWASLMVALYDDAGGSARLEQLTHMFSSSQTSLPPTPAIDPATTNGLLLAVYGGAPNPNGVGVTYGAASGFTLQNQVSSTSLTLKNANLALASKALADGTAVPETAHSSTPAAQLVSASIIISNQNQPPVANAGTDQAVDPGATVTLNGTLSSDIDSGISTYAWTQISGTSVTLSDATVAQPTFTAPTSVEGATLVFGLTVTDIEGASSTQDTVTIIVGAAPNQQVWNGSSFERQPVRSWVGDTWVS